jgi:SOS-response transcriptional repressor LexA
MQRVLDFVRTRVSIGPTPTLKEIADHFGWSSPATVAGIIQTLRERRLIRRRGNDIIVLAAAAQFPEMPHGA